MAEEEGGRGYGKRRGVLLDGILNLDVPLAAGPVLRRTYVYESVLVSRELDFTNL